MNNVLQNKALYRITLGKEKITIDIEKKIKWYDKKNKAHGSIGMSISP
jgi:hypothetical protein